MVFCPRFALYQKLERWHVESFGNPVNQICVKCHVSIEERVCVSVIIKAYTCRPTSRNLIMSGSDTCENRPADSLALSPHRCGKGVKITWLPIAEDGGVHFFLSVPLSRRLGSALMVTWPSKLRWDNEITTHHSGVRYPQGLCRSNHTVLHLESLFLTRLDDMEEQSKHRPYVSGRLLGLLFF